MTESQNLPENADGDIVRPQRPPRQRAFNIPSIVLLVSAVLVAIHLIRFYVLSAEQDIALLVRAAFIPLRYTGGFDFDVFAVTSPFTYALLHGGFEHLIVNLVWLVAFGSPLAQRFSGTRFLVFAAVSSLAAALLHFSFYSHDPSPLIGASGAIAGMMGAAARFAFRVDRSQSLPRFSGPVLSISSVMRQRGVLVFLGVWGVSNAVTGVYSATPDGGGIAWVAHVGGFLLGFFGVALFDPPNAAKTNLEMRADRAHHDG